MTCPVCSARSPGYSRHVGEFRVLKCGICGLEYTTPVPTEDDLRAFYGAYSDVRADAEIQKLNALRFLDSGVLEDAKTVVDIGCGKGVFLDALEERSFTSIGLDLVPQHPRAVSELEGEHDAATMWGVLEHVTDPVGLMRSAAKLVKKGGILVLTTVDAESDIPYHYKPPEHLTYWTRRSLEVLMNRTGFRIISMKPYEMAQRAEIYFDRLFARTPENIAKMMSQQLMAHFKNTMALSLPTNEVILVARKK